MSLTDTNESDVTKEKWYKEWRPIAAYTYLVICIHDFMLAPIFTAIFSWWAHVPYAVWQPLTVQGGGLFHISFGAIIGVSAWGRYIENKETIRSGEFYGQTQPYYNQSPYQTPYQPPYDPSQQPQSPVIIQPPVQTGPVQHHHPLTPQ